jgi:hypothetical protein
MYSDDMRRLRVSADYHAFPVWDLDDGGMVDASTLPIDDQLAARLQAWADRFDATLDMDDPTASGFASPDEETAFVADGRQLARALQVQLGSGFEVRFGTDAPQG